MSELYFPYKWKAFGSNYDEKPQMNPLLTSLIQKDFIGAKSLLAQGARFEDIHRKTFQRVLYEFLSDYEIMEFLVQNGFNRFHFSWIDCTDGIGRRWGIVARAYQNKRIVALLFSAGFDLRGNGMYWSGGTSQQLVRYLQYHFDKEFIDLMLSYGKDAMGLLSDLLWDDTEEIYDTEKYLRSNPEVKWKGYALCDKWEEEIPEPPKPHYSLFLSKNKKEQLEKNYEKRMLAYMERKKVQKEYLDNITLEDIILMQWTKKFGAMGLYATNTVDLLIAQGKQEQYRKGEYGM